MGEAIPRCRGQVARGSEAGGRRKVPETEAIARTGMVRTGVNPAAVAGDWRLESKRSSGPEEVPPLDVEAARFFIPK